MNAFLKYMAGLIKNHVASPINQKNTGDEDVRPLPSKTPVNQERQRDKTILSSSVLEVIPSYVANRRKCITIWLEIHVV